MKLHNFSAGPSVLPREVMHQASEAVNELDNSKLSLIEISHRSKAFIDIMDEACERALTLTGLENKGYKALFLQGGASLQFLMVAYNLLQDKAGYLNTGTWSDKAIKEAKLFGEVVEVSSSKDKNYNYIPKNYSIPLGLDYLHITTNNTIFGTQYKSIPEINIPLIADMSSDIFSRNFDYSKFDLFYAGAQKNMGIPGVTICLVKEEFLTDSDNPKYLNLKLLAKSNSILNTPPTMSIFVLNLVTNWMLEMGGIDYFQNKAHEQSTEIYDFIDNNSDVLDCKVENKFRSKIEFFKERNFSKIK